MPYARHAVVRQRQCLLAERSTACDGERPNEGSGLACTAALAQHLQFGLALPVAELQVDVEYADLGRCGTATDINRPLRHPYDTVRREPLDLRRRPAIRRAHDDQSACAVVVDLPHLAAGV